MQDRAPSDTETPKFFDGAFQNSTQAANDLDYIPLPEANSVVSKSARRTR
jgi:phosphate transport system substrate-binding protein